MPYRALQRNPFSSRFFYCYPKAVKVTGKFGWAAAPEPVQNATSVIAAQLLKRAREAPFGLVQIGLDGAVVRAMQIARDPQLNLELGPYSRNRGLA